MKYLQFRSRRSAFTLIELLVVITILSLLAAILLPVFARVRQNAQRTMCQTHLKQMGIAVGMYIQDNDERYPMGLVPTEGDAKLVADVYGGQTPKFQTVFDTLETYHTDQRLGRCISDSDPADVDFNANGSGRTSYTVNDLVMKSPVAYILGGTPAEPPILHSQVNQPAWVPIIWDAANYSTLIPASDPMTDLSPTAFPCYLRVSKRHLGGANVLFADYHVKWTSTKPTLATTQYSNEYWNADPTQ